MRRAWFGIGASTELVDAEQTGWRGKKYRRPVRASKYAHLKEYGGTFGRFAKRSPVRSYPLFEDAVNGRLAKFGSDFSAESEKAIFKAFKKRQRESSSLAKTLIKQGLA